MLHAHGTPAVREAAPAALHVETVARFLAGRRRSEPRDAAGHLQEAVAHADDRWCAPAAEAAAVVQHKLIIERSIEGLVHFRHLHLHLHRLADPSGVAAVVFIAAGNSGMAVARWADAEAGGAQARPYELAHGMAAAGVTAPRGLAVPRADEALAEAAERTEGGRAASAAAAAVVTPAITVQHAELIHALCSKALTRHLGSRCGLTRNSALTVVQSLLHRCLERPDICHRPRVTPWRQLL